MAGKDLPSSARGKFKLSGRVYLAGFLACVASIALAACQAQADAKGAASVLLVCNGSTIPCPREAHFDTVQAAVTHARPGSWVLIWPGVYHEDNPLHHAGIWITTSRLHIRGLNRNAVIIDGSHGSSTRPCPSAPGAQDLTPRNGIVVWKASGVSIQNLTVCDYLGGAQATAGNEIWWDGGEESGDIGMSGFGGSYLTATSMYQPVGIHDQHLAEYGIYVGNTRGPGTIADSYASNMAGGAFYVGACQRSCDTELVGDHGASSAVGYLGTNSGGQLTIRNSVFDNNRTGIAPSSLNNDDAPPPQDGRCPGSPAKSCTIIEGNKIMNNNNSDAPVSGDPPVGVGVNIDGGKYDTVIKNIIAGNGSWGVLVNDNVDVLGDLAHARCQGGLAGVPASGICLFAAVGNQVTRNTFVDNGKFGNVTNGDLASLGLTARSAGPPNCFYANETVRGVPLTSAPVGIEQAGVGGRSCGSPGPTADPALLQQLRCAALRAKCATGRVRYPQQDMVDIAPLPRLRSMPDPCAGVPGTGCRELAQLSQR